MGALQRFENQLEQMISGVFARAFRSAVQPVEIAVRAPARGRQLRPDPQPRPPPGAQRLPRRAVRRRPRAARAPTARSRSPRAGRDAPRARRTSSPTSSPGRSSIDLRDQRRPRPPAASGCAARRSPGQPRPAATPRDTAVRRATRDPRAQRGAAPARAARHRHRPRQRRRPAHQRPRGLPQAHRDPGRGRPGRRQPDPRITVLDLGSTNGMSVNGKRVEQATLADGATMRIGNTTMSLRRSRRGRAETCRS